MRLSLARGPEAAHRFSAISQRPPGHAGAMTVFDRRPVPALAGAPARRRPGAHRRRLRRRRAHRQRARQAAAPRTAAQLLVDVQQARLDGLSGTIVQNADLGLPSLPGLGGSGSSDLTSLVSGSHTLRLWYAGPNRVRLALLGSLGESDVVRNGTDLWTWSSKDKTATHRTLPPRPRTARPASARPRRSRPQQAADEALKAITPSTKVSTDGTAVVAGRSAYELVLRAPRRRLPGRLGADRHRREDARADAGPGVREEREQARLRGRLHLASTRPHRRPRCSRFNPPPGHQGDRVGIRPAIRRARTEAPSGDSGETATAASADKPKVVGVGLDLGRRGEAPDGCRRARRSGGPGSLADMLKALPKVSGTWGSGHLLQGTLFSAVLTDDGRVAVGAVAPDTLYAALGS